MTWLPATSLPYLPRPAVPVPTGSPPQSGSYSIHASVRPDGSLPCRRPSRFPMEETHRQTPTDRRFRPPCTTMIGRALQTALSCRGACRRGFGRSRRGHWVTSGSPALAPKPGSRAFFGRCDIEANDNSGFGGEVRVVALTRTCELRDRSCCCAGTADVLDVNIAPRPGQRRPIQRANPSGGGLVQQLQNPLVGGRRRDRLLAGPRLVLQPFKAMAGTAMPPKG